MMTDTLGQNVTQAVPFFRVQDMTASLRFYVDGLGFELKNKWMPDGPDKIRWCWLDAGGGALMLQERLPGRDLTGASGAGVSVCFMCRDALAIYRNAVSKGLSPKNPFVGNGLWVVSFIDPDGFQVDFESATQIPEETEYDPKLHS